MRFTFFIIALCFGLEAFASNSLEPVRLVSMKQDYDWTGDAATTQVHTQITFSVATKGCTGSYSFEPIITTVNETQKLRIVRKTPDTCKGTPTTTEVNFVTNRMRLADFYPIVIENPVLPEGINMSPGHLLDVEN